MMEGSDQEGVSSAASMEETSANGELSVYKLSDIFGCTVIFDRPYILCCRAVYLIEAVAYFICLYNCCYIYNAILTFLNSLTPET